ncbi:MarR family winged helix-turn-helix transcriptional regulator [Rhodoferax sp.]|uniref:MarR family winged helix-turn-helix transcriptional regulator n=1 Tax=Rhodoferax sp. TaxID=50421 RepID=UPI002ACDDA7E|nr:MarR family transcriptional regulator [Rhodoferax sp.]MDZ7921463.1 MarR family transcriptional regulator [Rhodoferax sp.]
MPYPSSPQEDAIQAMLRMFEALKAQMGLSLAEAGITLSPLHLHILSHCKAHPGGNQQALVQASTRDKGQIARITKELEAQALLHRSPDPQDGRSQILELTPAGLEACALFEAQHTALVQRMFATVTPEQLAVFTDVARLATAQSLSK